MARIFYTEKDIEDMVQKGVQELQVTDNMLLTGLAYEKAHALGLRLIQEKPDELPNAPVRPYLNQIPTTRPAPTASTPILAEAVSAPAISGEPPDLQQRITKAVIAKMGGEVDAALLANIVRRVLTTTGLK